MHPVIVDSLEEYLAGALPPAALRQFEAHLASCAACKQQMGGMQEISALFGTLRPDEEVAPSPSFVTRVMAQAGSRAVPTFWSLFSLDYGRRVIFASLLTLAVLGSYLVSRERQYAPGPPDADTVMALDQRSPAQESASDRDRMLVTLTSYEP